MADIKKELNDIKNAVYGREVRSSIHDGIKKINEESEESKQKAEEAHEITQDLLDETFDSAALEANFEQRLNDEIENLQPEWTGFKNDVTAQLAQIATNVKLFGAKGNGIDDDKEAFQTAVEQIADGQTLLIPEGVYNISSTISVNKPIVIMMNKNARLISTNKSAFNSTSGVINVTAPNVTIKGEGVIDVNDNNMRGINATDSDGLVIEGIRVINAGMRGISVNNSADVNISGVTTENCLNSAYGDNLSGSIRLNYCKNVYISNCFIKRSHGKGIAFQGCENFQVSKVTVDETFRQSVGIYFNNSTGGNVSFCTVENADSSALKYSRGSSNITVTNSSFSIVEKKEDDGNVGYVVLFQGAYHCSLIDSKIFGRNTSECVRIEDHPDPEGADAKHIRVIGNLIDSRGNSFRDEAPVSVHVRRRSVQTGYVVENIKILDNEILGGLQALRATNVTNISFNSNDCFDQDSTVVQISQETSVINLLDNNIKGCKDNGVTITGGEIFKVTGNNIYAEKNANAQHGVSVSGSYSKLGSITNNNIVGFTESLIAVLSSLNNDINIIGNIGEGTGQTSLGIDFRGNNARILGNQFKGVNQYTYVSSQSKEVQEDYITRSGSFVGSGDGQNVQFVIPHGMGVRPRSIQVMPGNQETGRRGINHANATGTENIYVYLKEAPVAGSGNVVINWVAYA